MTPHIYIVGQTASGKSRFAHSLALDLDLEILNTDSLLFYKDLDIGTAKPSRLELEEVKHYFVDLVDVGEEINASDYIKDAKKILLTNSKKLLCVGGSGFYINALDVGLLPLPSTDSKIKDFVEDIKDPVNDLKSKDPKTLETVSENDLYRVRRALEVYYQTKKPLSQWKKEFNPKPIAKKIAFEFSREELKKRVEKRTEIMLESGLVEEVESLLVKADKSWKPLKSVGYFQVLQFLEGSLKKEELFDEIVLRTMQLAKRQKTWFKKDKSVIWFKDDEINKARDFVKKILDGVNLWRV